MLDEVDPAAATGMGCASLGTHLCDTRLHARPAKPPISALDVLIKQEISMSLNSTTISSHAPLR
jgi:hypothetical protein